MEHPGSPRGRTAAGPERAAWLDGLPGLIGDLECRWSLNIGAPFQGEDVSCAWITPAALPDGRSAILKLGIPPSEGEQEIHGLRFWKNDDEAISLARVIAP